MGIADVIIWLVVVAIIVACFRALRGLFRSTPRPKPAPLPEAPVDTYLRKWSATRKMAEANDKDYWEGQFALRQQSARK